MKLQEAINEVAKNPDPGKAMWIAAHCTMMMPQALSALKAQHEALDILLAMLVESKPGFLPSKSPVWPALASAHQTIQRIENISFPSCPTLTEK